jgi:hypothetical protein
VGAATDHSKARAQSHSTTFVNDRDEMFWNGRLLMLMSTPKRTEWKSLIDTV